MIFGDLIGQLKCGGGGFGLSECSINIPAAEKLGQRSARRGEKATAGGMEPVSADLNHGLASGHVGASMSSLFDRFGLKNVSLFSKSKQLIGIRGILYYTGIKKMLVY